VPAGTALGRVYDEYGGDAVFESASDKARELRVEHSMVEHAGSDRPNPVLAQLGQKRILLLLIHVPDVFDIHSYDHPSGGSSVDVKRAKQEAG